MVVINLHITMHCFWMQIYETTEFAVNISEKARVTTRRFFFFFFGHCYCSVTKSSQTLCNPMNCSMPGSSVHHYLPEFAKFMSTEWMMLSKHLIFCHPLLLLPSTFPSIRVFSNKDSLWIYDANVGWEVMKGNRRGLGKQRRSLTLFVMINFLYKKHLEHL